MCGISGFLSNDPGAPANLQAVRRMNNAIRHRGPDADGVWQHGACTLGHRRLSIIDLSAEANQPMCNEDGSVALVANGEIYNFQELRKELLAKGHTFRSKSDSEVILHLYEPAYVAKLIASLQQGSIQVDRIWTLLMLELWFREFIDKPRSSSSLLQEA